jgi:hypothetical protein
MHKCDPTFTILNSSNQMLVEMTDKLGVRSNNDHDLHSIVSIIKSLEHTIKNASEQSKKNKEM